MFPMSPLEDHQVDRVEVYERISKGSELTTTNRTIGLIVTCVCSAVLALPKQLYPSFFIKSFPGGFSDGEIPVPIPNTAVKPACADDTPKGESRSLPGFSSTAQSNDWAVFCYYFA